MRLARFAPLLALASSIVLSGCVVDGGRYSVQEPQEESFPLTADGSFRLENVNGPVRVDAWDQSRVRIQATKRAADRAALQRLEIRIDARAEQVSVRTIHPRQPGRLFGSAPAVEYHVTVPRGASVRVGNTNGRIAVEGVRGALEIENTNGPVTIDGAGARVQTSTVNGAIQVRYVRADADALHRFATTNGSIEVALPDGAGGSLEASTVNGRISTQLPLANEQARRRSLKGRLGSGRGGFELETVNGSISVVRAATGMADASNGGASN